MDYYTTADLAQLLDDHASALSADDPAFSTQLRMCAHFLRLYAALEYIYRARLKNDLCEIGDQVNRLFNKDHTG